MNKVTSILSYSFIFELQYLKNKFYRSCHLNITVVQQFLLLSQLF